MLVQCAVGSRIYLCKVITRTYLHGAHNGSLGQQGLQYNPNFPLNYKVCDACLFRNKPRQSFSDIEAELWIPA